MPLHHQRKGPRRAGWKGQFLTHPTGLAGQQSLASALSPSSGCPRCYHIIPTRRVSIADFVDRKGQHHEMPTLLGPQCPSRTQPKRHTPLPLPVLRKDIL